MKSNIKGQGSGSKQQGKRRVSIGGLSLAERNKVFSELVNESFERLLEANGEDMIIPIFEYLMSDKYLMHFIPENYKNVKNINNTRSAINLSVKNIMMRYLDQQINSIIEKAIDRGISRKEIVFKIQNSEVVQEILKANSVNNDVEIIVKNQIKKSIQKHLEIIESEEEVMDLLENQQKIDDEKFIDLVSEYTDGYRFLAEDRYVYTANNGSFSSDENTHKFKNADQYFRFIDIQNKLQRKMMYNGGNEAKAIKDLLIDEQDDVESAILNKRLEVINKNLDMEL